MKSALGRVCAVATIIAAACGGQEAIEEVQKAEAAGTELSSSCAGVRPGSASSWTRVIDVDSDSICGVDTSDASGNVIFGWQNDFEVERDFWDVFTTVGHQRGAVSRFGNGRIFPQEWGFMTLTDHNQCGVNPFCTPVAAVDSWTPNGTLIRSTALSFDVKDVQLDLAGGVAVVGLRPQQPFTIVSQRFDAHSNPLAFQAVVARGTTQPLFVVTGVSVSGLSLVLWNGDFSGFPAGSIVGRWVDRFGQAVTGRFLVAPFAGVGEISSTPLIDGSIAIRVTLIGDGSEHRYVALVPSGSTVISQVPPWLSNSHEAHVFIVRGGTAYALLSPVDRSTLLFGVDPLSCKPERVELLASGGNSCGDLFFDSARPGPLCPSTQWGGFDRDRRFASNIGRDGTLIIRGVTGAANRNCKDRVFPGLLR